MINRKQDPLKPLFQGCASRQVDWLLSQNSKLHRDLLMANQEIFKKEQYIKENQRVHQIKINQLHLRLEKAQQQLVAQRIKLKQQIKSLLNQLDCSRLQLTRNKSLLNQALYPPTSKTFTCSASTQAQLERSNVSVQTIYQHYFEPSESEQVNVESAEKEKDTTVRMKREIEELTSERDYYMSQRSINQLKNFQIADQLSQIKHTCSEYFNRCLNRTNSHLNLNHRLCSSRQLLKSSSKQNIFICKEKQGNLSKKLAFSQLYLFLSHVKNQECKLLVEWMVEVVLSLQKKAKSARLVELFERMGEISRRNKWVRQKVKAYQLALALD